MKNIIWSDILFGSFISIIIGIFLFFPYSCHANELPNSPVPNDRPFYDRTAKIELATAITLDAIDNAQTCHNLARGGHEDFLPSQHCPQITLMLTAQLAAQESLAYLFHRTHHYKLERVTRFISIEQNVSGLIYSKRTGAW